MRIEELQQQRESAESPGELSQQLLGKLRQQMLNGQTLEWSIGYLARMVIAIAKDPRFADRPLGRGAVSRSAKRRPPQTRY
jgi:hypothetical protein